MTQWVEIIDGKSYWFMKFDPGKLALLQKYGHAFERLTKLDLSRIVV